MRKKIGVLEVRTMIESVKKAEAKAKLYISEGKWCYREKKGNVGAYLPSLETRVKLKRAN